MLSHEVRTAKEPQMFRNGRTGDWKSAGDLSGWLAPAAKKVKDGPARGVGQGLEGGFLVSGRICNLTVTHNA